jgi:hypothetical protein
MYIIIGLGLLFISFLMHQSGVRSNWTKNKTFVSRHAIKTIIRGK